MWELDEIPEGYLKINVRVKKNSIEKIRILKNIVRFFCQTKDCEKFVLSSKIFEYSVLVVIV